MDKIQELINKSGNNLHYEVVNFLREKEWDVVVSPYYNDYTYEKVKEIDILARRNYPVMDSFGKPKSFISIRLFIECKYINGDIVFWFDKKNKKSVEKRIIKDTKLSEESSYIKKHHYWEGNDVAKLFTTNLNKEDIIYKALTQSLNSMIFFKHSNAFPAIDRRIKIAKVFDYPVIICNSFDRLYKVDKEDKREYSEIKSNFQLETNYTYLDKEKNSISDYFIVDVINFKYLEGFIRSLEEKEIYSIGQYLEWKSDS